MFARITRYKMRPGTREEAVAKLESMRAQIMALPGSVQLMNAANEDGSGYVVAINESQEQSEANLPAVQKIWENFAEFLEEPPMPEGFDVVVDWMK